MVIYGKWSYSKVLTYKMCPRKFKYVYVTGLKRPQKKDWGDSGLIGTAVHLGLEKDKETAVKWYLDNFDYFTEDIKTEMEKIKIMIDKAKPIVDSKHG